MTSEQDVTLGEVHRICLEIRAAVDKQNGRVRKLEDDALKIKTVWTVGGLALGLVGDTIKHKLGL